jgi:Tol biopolymer transport system component
VRWIVERCLAKDPEDRYIATRDLARDLATIRDRLSEAPSGELLASGVGPRRRTALALVLGAVALIAASLFAGSALWKTSSPPPPKFQRLTFRRGSVGRARFAPDGQSIIYSAKWGTEPSQIFMTRLGNPESLKLPVPDSTSLLAVSSRGELALSLDGPTSSTLATMPLAGGAPREVADDVRSADWTPDGKGVVVLRNGRLEFPIGKVLYQATSISTPRFSPKGDRIAFRESRADLSGLGEAGEWWISTIDLAGKKTELRQNAKTRIVWNSTGDEIWFASGAPGEVGTIRAVTLAGRSRVVTRLPANNVLEDVSRDGRVLLAIGNIRNEAWCLPAGETKERDLGWFSSTDAADISADGKAVLLREYGEAGGPWGSTYLRRVDGSAAVKVTEGTAEALSPDAKLVACVRENPPRILLVPTGAGEPRTIVNEGFEEYSQSSNSMRFSPDGRRLFFVGIVRGH